jgi:hypothetical protein
MNTATRKTFWWVQKKNLMKTILNRPENCLVDPRPLQKRVWQKSKGKSSLIERG